MSRGSPKARGVREGPPNGGPKDWPRELGTVAWGRPSFHDAAGPKACPEQTTEARDRLVDTSLHTYIQNFADADFFMTPMHSTYQDKLICTLEYMVWPFRTGRNLPLKKTNVSAKLFLCTFTCIDFREIFPPVRLYQTVRLFFQNFPTVCLFQTVPLFRTLP